MKTLSVEQIYNEILANTMNIDYILFYKSSLRKFGEINTYLDFNSGKVCWQKLIYDYASSNAQ